MVFSVDEDIVAVTLYGSDDLAILFDTGIGTEIGPEARGEGKADFFLARPDVKSARARFVLPDKEEAGSHGMAGTVLDRAKLLEYVGCRQAAGPSSKEIMKLFASGQFADTDRPQAPPAENETSSTRMTDISRFLLLCRRGRDDLICTL